MSMNINIRKSPDVAMQPYEPQGEIDVMDPGVWENENSETIGEWYAVVDDGGIFAYVNDERLAWVLLNVVRARAFAKKLLKGERHEPNMVENFVRGED